jgi:hypothetical protein
MSVSLYKMLLLKSHPHHRNKRSFVYEQVAKELMIKVTLMWLTLRTFPTAESPSYDLLFSMPALNKVAFD